ncbi:MAG: DNA repair protein RecN [Gammaproteobacteria bacterium]|nr:DNA repair protein RecN [Gammaproteobacteria bacterium]
MLSFLQIRNYTIVESLDLDFASGFTCITGETGAGKSILVGALGLLCGNRADSSAIRSGASRAELGAGFELAAGSAALAWLQDRELDDGSTCLLRRTLNDNGRSRGWINGTAVTLQQLAELGEHLVEIHGQNEHLLLVRRDEAFRLLDASGGYAKPLNAVERAYRAWSALEEERQSLLDESPLDPGERDLFEYQVRELQDGLLSAEEFRAVEQAHRKQSRGADIIAALETAAAALRSDVGGAAGEVFRAAESLEPFGELDKEIAAAAALLREAAINCDEAHRSILDAQSRIDLDPEALARLEQQLASQHDLARKHRVEPEQLEEVLERLERRIENAGSLEQRLAELEEQREAALQAYRKAAHTLHARRTKRAATLSAAVTELMQQLGMEGGRFEIALSHEPEGAPSPRGDDRIELRVAANRGSSPGPLRKVASGGELSRISLAVKVAARAGPAAATQVFDEVDAGIGGETAHAVGALLRSLSDGGQALCVTHLAQVAVFADRQIQVLKSSDERETRVETAQLAEQDRVDEIARMLGGKLSEQSRAHASELLATARTRH